MAYTTLVAGTTITAAWANASVRDQSVSPFASAAARSSAISSPVEGMVSHLNDTNTLGVYSGAAWSTTGPVHGAPTSWTPTVTQSGNVTVTNTGSTYSRLGRRIFADFILTVTGSGTASNVITVALPVTAAFTASQDIPIGVGRIFNTSASQKFTAILEFASATTMWFRGSMTSGAPGADQTLGDDQFVEGLASGDVLAGTLSYNAASDA